MQTLQENTTLQGGKYRIISVLGQGGFGITYLAEQTMLERRVAIKEFYMKELCSRDGSTSHVTIGTEGSRETVTRFREKFLKEARNIAKLNHPNIVKIIDVFEENGTAYYVMEYAEGGSLADKVKREGYLSESVATRYIMQVAEALAYVHARKMNHLDVKPANIMLTGTDTAVLIDFGLSKQYNVVGQQTSTTPVGISEGYAPMEQYKQGGVGEFSPETDIYALGATFFKLLTGITPPSASDVNEDGVPVDELKAKGVNEKVIEVICEAMKPRKKDRMKGVKGFIEALGDTKDKLISVVEGDETTMMNITKEYEKEEQQNFSYRQSFSSEKVSKGKGTKHLPINKTKNKRIFIILGFIFFAIIGIIGYLFRGGLKFLFEEAFHKEPVDVLHHKSENYFEYDYFSEGLVQVKKNGKWGFINTKGKLVIPHMYDYATSFYDDRASVRIEEKWGCIDRNGKEILPCIYDYVGSFSEGLAVIEKEGTYGYVDKTGNVVIPCKYENASFFSGGFAAVKKGNKWGYINENGKNVIPYEYEDVWSFSEGLAAVKKGNKWGYINSKGKVVIPFLYFMAFEFSEGLAMVFYRGGFWNSKDMYISKNGREVIDCSNYSAARCFSNGIARVKARDHLGYVTGTGVIDKGGNEIVPCEYDWISELSDGLIAVKKGDKWGYLNVNGEVVIPCKYIYEWAGLFSDGLAPVKKNGNWGYMNKKGKIVIPCIYEDACPFSEGLSKVKRNGKWGFIDKMGKEVIPCIYDDTSYFPE